MGQSLPAFTPCSYALIVILVAAAYTFYTSAARRCGHEIYRFGHSHDFDMSGSAMTYMQKDILAARRHEEA